MNRNAKMDLTSIITPSYNSSKFIKEAIKSVLLQTYKRWELIIVDDSSTDDSARIIQHYLKKDKRIKFIQLNKNSGAAVARNTAIRVAEGRYIAFLDSDDVWLPEKLEKQIQFMKKHNVSFTYSSYHTMDEEGNLLGCFMTKKQITYTSLLKTCDIGCSTVIYDAQLTGKYYMPVIEKRQDYGLWLKIVKKNKQVIGILEPLAVYRMRKSSLSANKLQAIRYQWQIYRKNEKLSLLASIYYFIHYAYFGFFKYKKKRKKNINNAL